MKLCRFVAWKHGDGDGRSLATPTNEKPPPLIPIFMAGCFICHWEGSVSIFDLFLHFWLTSSLCHLYPPLTFLFPNSTLLLHPYFYNSISVLKYGKSGDLSVSPWQKTFNPIWIRFFPFFFFNNYLFIYLLIIIYFILRLNKPVELKVDITNLLFRKILNIFFI